MTAPIAWQVKTFSHLPSTQDMVRQLASEGAGEGLAVQALMQTAGRGRLGNQWASPLGNLYLSLLLRPGDAANRIGQLAFAFAVAAADAIYAVIAPGHAVTLKWPNDVLIDGRKCAGILLETELDARGMVKTLIAGLGVNIMAPPEDRIGLRDVAVAGIAVHPFRDLLLDRIAEVYGQWQAEGFAPIRARWLARAHGLGQMAQARLPTGTFAGVFDGIDADGALLLDMPDGDRKVVQAGEIWFQPV